jgi:hypothetical protein
VGGEIVWHLLMAQEAEDTQWHLNWITAYLTSREQRLLVDLTEHCKASFPGGHEDIVSP